MRLKSASGRISISSATRIPLLASLFFTFINHTTVVAQDAPQPITYSFLDESGAPLGSPQPLKYITCVPLDKSQLAGGTFKTVQTSDLRSALNIYGDPFCQLLLGSSVGQWDDIAPVTGAMAVRWEGAAPANLTTGGIRPDGFPPGMFVQTKVPSGPSFALDPAKGRLLVGVVSGVLIIGVAVGIYQVYQASLFEPPPKKKKEKKQTGLNIKKVKKKDAYYKKPERPDQNSFQRLHSPAPSLPIVRNNNRDSHFSLSSADWGQQRTMYNNGSDTVVVEMAESTARPSHNTPYRENAASTVNLMYFENENNNNQNSNNRGRGRGGEVLVPMDTFDNNHHHTSQYNRSTVRRPNSPGSTQYI